MDWIIEKATELGVARVVPVAAQRSVLQLSGERLVKRMQHWRRIAQAASEQCGRNRIMAIDDPCSLRAFIGGDADAHGLALLCHPNADSNLADALSPTATRITILVGPEGGWSPEELAIAERSGAQRIQFGTRVLRTETAGLALVSAISALQGWN
jgi:16S rRNA (uracil1498-N3)-methyltransferase